MHGAKPWLSARKRYVSAEESATSGSEWSCVGEGCEGDVRPSLCPGVAVCVRTRCPLVKRSQCDAREPPPPVTSRPVTARVMKPMSVRPGVTACVRMRYRSVGTSHCDTWGEAAAVPT
ncbi:uncharacterized protein [Emydura macquarii macquarii]|uniref:uncharacterized protein isoform X2 n=1 Tax=Emydura macquarii macquarii TaxID=1129001 RepID=UPI00352AF227